MLKEDDINGCLCLLFEAGAFIFSVVHGWMFLACANLKVYNIGQGL